MLFLKIHPYVCKRTSHPDRAWKQRLNKWRSKTRSRHLTRSTFNLLTSSMFEISSYLCNFCTENWKNGRKQAQEIMYPELTVTCKGGFFRKILPKWRYQLITNIPTPCSAFLCLVRLYPSLCSLTISLNCSWLRQLSRAVLLVDFKYFSLPLIISTFLVFYYLHHVLNIKWIPFDHCKFAAYRQLQENTPSLPNDRIIDMFMSIIFPGTTINETVARKSVKSFSKKRFSMYFTFFVFTQGYSWYVSMFRKCSTVSVIPIWILIYFSARLLSYRRAVRLLVV